MQYLFLLGRQAALSRLELLSLLPAKVIEDSSPLFLILETEQALPNDFLKRMGGADRLALLVGQPAKAWGAEDIAEKLTPLPAKKFALGVSVIQKSKKMNSRELKRLVQEVKNLIKKKGGAMKFVLPQSPTLKLNAAQVIFNSLTKDDNRELLLAEGKAGWYLARTLQVQDIQAYERRDTGKPARDAKAGMLPPKLAQIMINIAVPGESATILDPFCGTGTILQEGWLMGHQMIGMDEEAQMLKASTKNLDWLSEQFETEQDQRPPLIQHDVRQSFPDELKGQIDAIVTEPYLGQPLKQKLLPLEADQQLKELGQLYQQFFANAKKALKAKGAVLFLFPAFRQHSGAWALFPNRLIDEIGALGYRHNHLAKRRDDLVYARPDALVGREITFWIKENGT